MHFSTALQWLGGNLEAALEVTPEAEIADATGRYCNDGSAKDAADNGSSYWARSQPSWQGAQEPVVGDELCFFNGDVEDEDITEDEWVNPKCAHLDVAMPSLVAPNPCALQRSVSCTSAGSIAEYHERDETIIIFDWDDTLCPTTTCKEHARSQTFGKPTGGMAAALEGFTLLVTDLLARASELAAKVLIITNATDGWVKSCCEAWMPNLWSSLERVEVTSARSNWEPRGVLSPTGWKTQAFEVAIRQFYSRRRHQSWKNIIVVGDAPYEHEALSRVAMHAPCGHGKRCRSKSVKLAARPSIESLAHELQMLKASLGEIVLHDDSLSVSLVAELL